MTRRFRPFDPFERGGPFEAGREIRIPRPPRRFWFGVGLFGIAFLIFILASPIIWFFTELQWYNALGLRDVFTTRLVLQTVLFVASLALAFIYLAANVVVALRIRSGPGLRAVGIRRSSIRSPIGVIGLIGAALIALILSGGAGSQWQTLALYQHAATDRDHRPGARPGRLLLPADAAVPALGRQLGPGPRLHERPAGRRTLRVARGHLRPQPEPAFDRPPVDPARDLRLDPRSLELARPVRPSLRAQQHRRVGRRVHRRERPAALLHASRPARASCSRACSSSTPG